MSFQFSTQISPAQVREATAGIFWRQALQPKMRWAVVALLLLGQVPITLLFRADQDGNLLVRAMLSLLLLFSLWCLAWVALQYYLGLAQKNFERIVAAPVQVSLDEDAYRFSADWGQGALEWSRFDSLWQFPGVWVLLQHAQGGASVLLPSQDLSPQAQAFIRAKLAKGSA